ncbi:hypothetical protein BO94DRAFT_39523 [Aspergillus sclerotioniger CBS 115572]|uniref:Uncharacterized protein n=1 Tax=Aspergillus sclerotioniger CBS 115572 TaxID=1450535 RepID=A0A317WSZ5_9EURO|nr:hypothetical protein BO94DRAFT_39523 [Aspergillus sclerotioniger CBS 115572]PWY89534.1 hypothetical protein BO94DRAFT_39523 [Aspergillus sclerotioniger CBS 115572]
MDLDIVQQYGPGMSFYRSQIQLSSSNENGTTTKATVSSSLSRYSSALRLLQTSNQNLDYKMSMLRSNVIRLNVDLSKLQQHVKAFHNELLTTWQADTLTRLVEVVYERQGWKFPGGVVVGDHIHIGRDRQTRMLVTAARRIRKSILWNNFGLSVQYYSALQRYIEIAHMRSTNSFRTECTFARRLVSEKEEHWGMYRFWGALFPLCYSRSVEESAEIF